VVFNLLINAGTWLNGVVEDTTWGLITTLGHGRSNFFAVNVGFGEGPFFEKCPQKKYNIYGWKFGGTFAPLIGSAHLLQFLRPEAQLCD